MVVFCVHFKDGASKISWLGWVESEKKSQEWIQNFGLSSRKNEFLINWLNSVNRTALWKKNGKNRLKKTVLDLIEFIIFLFSICNSANFIISFFWVEAEVIWDLFSFLILLFSAINFPLSTALIFWIFSNFPFDFFFETGYR